MDETLFLLGLLGCGLAILGFIALSVAGFLIERNDGAGAARKRFGRAAALSAFALFLLLGISVVPLLVGVFVPMLKESVPADISIIEDNDMLIVFFFWAIMIAGIVIALPAMRKSGFFSGPA